ncbi:MAG: hypothetical protein ACOCU6_01525 [Nanoarchaeota archaeon]
MDLSKLVNGVMQPFKSKILTIALLTGMSSSVAMAQGQEPSKADVINNVVGTETTISLSESERAIPVYSDNGNYSILATPELRFPSSKEVSEYGLNKDVAYAFFDINDGDQGKYPYSAIALGSKGWDVARTDQTLAVRLDDIVEAETYTRFALNSDYGVIASYSGSIEWKTIGPAVDSLLQGRDKKEYTKEQSPDDVLEKQQESKEKQQSEIITYDSRKQKSDVAQDTVKEDRKSRKQDVPDSTGIQETVDRSRESELDQTPLKTDNQFPFYVELSTTGLRGDNGDPSDGFVAEQAKPFFEDGKRIGIKAGYNFDVANNLRLRAGLGYDHIEARNMLYDWKSNTDAVSVDLNALYEITADRKVSPILMFGGGLRGYKATSESTSDNKIIENTEGITPYLQGGMGARVELGDVNLILGASSEVNFTDKFEGKYGGNGIINNDYLNRFFVALEFDIPTGERKQKSDVAQDTVKEDRKSRKQDVPDSTGIQETVDRSRESELDQTPLKTDNQFPFYVELSTTGLRGDNGDPSDGFVAEQAKPFFEDGKRIGIKAGYNFDVANNLRLRAGLGYDHIEARNMLYDWKSNTDAVSVDLNALYEITADRKVSPILMFGGGLRGYKATSESTSDNKIIENTEGITPYLQGGMGARVELGDVNLILGASSEVNFTDKFEGKYGGNGIINNDYLNRFFVALEFDIPTGERKQKSANTSSDVEAQANTANQSLYESSKSTIDDKTEQQTELLDSLGNNYFSNVLTTGLPLNYR